MSYKFSQPGAEIQNILDLARLQIAAPYDAGTSYTAGMYCTKDDGFYVANASTSGTWDGSKWTAVTVGDVLTSINTNLTQSPTAPTAYSSRATNITGGYIKIGKMVFVSVAFKLAVTVSSLNVVLAGLPTSSESAQALAGINADSHATLFAYVNNYGEIAVGAAASGNAIRVSGVYFT